MTIGCLQHLHVVNLYHLHCPSQYALLYISDTSGDSKRFIIGFFNQSGSHGDVEIHLALVENADSVNVSVLASFDESFPRHVLVLQHAVTVIRVNGRIRVGGAPIEDKGILIESDRDISVHMVNPASNLVLPESSLGLLYTGSA